MRYPLENVNPVDSIRWINTAISLKANKILILYDSFEDIYIPHYIINATDESKFINNLKDFVQVVGIVKVDIHVRKAAFLRVIRVNYKDV